MAVSIAAERAQRALQSKTPQFKNYPIGDQVEFSRAPANKDLAGWCGPATVVNVSPMRTSTLNSKATRSSDI
eukprot:12891080-Prorocentrum_lima.AAC.1